MGNKCCAEAIEYDLGEIKPTIKKIECQSNSTGFQQTVKKDQDESLQPPQPEELIHTTQQKNSLQKKITISLSLSDSKASKMSQKSSVYSKLLKHQWLHQVTSPSVLPSKSLMSRFEKESRPPEEFWEEEQWSNYEEKPNLTVIEKNKDEAITTDVQQIKMNRSTQRITF